MEFFPIIITITIFLAIVEIIILYLIDIKSRIKIISNIIVMILFGILFSYFINGIINPNPKIDIKCIQGEEEIEIILVNPSSSYPADKYNVLLNIENLGGGSGYSDYSLCDVEDYQLKNNHVVPYTTLINCEYIPPKSEVHLTIDLENDSYYRNDKKIIYSYWGRTTPKEENLELICD